MKYKTHLINDETVESLIKQIKKEVEEKHPGYLITPWWDLDLEDNFLVFSQCIYDPKVKGSEQKYSLEKELYNKELFDKFSETLEKEVINL